MSEADKFYRELKKVVASVKKAQLRSVICREVNWERHTMTAADEANGLEYLDVQLGFGFTYIRPAAGTRCLIGLLEGKETLTFLVNAEQVEEVKITSEKIICNGGENDGWVKVRELTEKLNALEKDINSLKQVFTSWVAVPNDGGAALKAALATWAGQTLTETRQADIENDKITH
jgi:hypothetical protein